VLLNSIVGKCFGRGVAEKQRRVGSSGRWAGAHAWLARRNAKRLFQRRHKRQAAQVAVFFDQAARCRWVSTINTFLGFYTASRASKVLLVDCLHYE
jgi:hypothetical protein